MATPEEVVVPAARPAGEARPNVLEAVKDKPPMFDPDRDIWSWSEPFTETRPTVLQRIRRRFGL